MGDLEAGDTGVVAVVVAVVAGASASFKIGAIEYPLREGLREKCPMRTDLSRLPLHGGGGPEGPAIVLRYYDGNMGARCAGVDTANDKRSGRPKSIAEWAARKSAII